MKVKDILRLLKRSKVVRHSDARHASGLLKFILTPSHGQLRGWRASVPCHASRRLYTKAEAGFGHECAAKQAHTTVCHPPVVHKYRQSTRSIDAEEDKRKTAKLTHSRISDFIHVAMPVLRTKQEAETRRSSPSRIGPSISGKMMLTYLSPRYARTSLVTRHHRDHSQHELPARQQQLRQRRLRGQPRPVLWWARAPGDVVLVCR